MIATYRLHVVGGLYLTRGGSMLEGTLANRKPLALLGILSLAGDAGLGRSRAAGLLWPDVGESKAKDLLKQVVYLIRKETEAPDIVAGSTTLRLNRELCCCDLFELEVALADGCLDRILSLYRGPLFDGVYLDDHPLIQERVDLEQNRLLHRVQGVIRKAAASLEAAGRYEDAVELWLALLRLEPLSDLNEAGLLRSLIAAGDRAAALRHGRGYAARVRRELEAEPSPEILRILQS